MKTASHLRLSNLVDTLSSKTFDREDRVFYHWEISGRNILIDPETGQLTGLVDWEVLYTRPPTLIRSRYPPTMHGTDIGLIS